MQPQSGIWKRFVVVASQRKTGDKLPKPFLGTFFPRTSRRLLYNRLLFDSGVAALVLSSGPSEAHQGWGGW